MINLTLKGLKLIVEANFYLSVSVMLAICLLTFTGSSPVFILNDELYGPLANNFRIMLLYLAISEVIICFFCFITKKFEVVLIVGFFLIMAIGSLKFYGTTNNVEIDSNLFLFFLYTGFSHILFGITVSTAKKINFQPFNKL